MISPTLITCGCFDEARPQSMQEVVKILPNGKLVIFENSAHIANMEKSEKYLKILAEFVSST